MNKSRFYQKFFSRRSVNSQLRLIFISSVLLPVILIGVFIYPYSMSQLKQNYENLTTSDAKRIRSVLLDVTTQFYKTSEDIAEDTDLRSLLSGTYTSEDQILSAMRQYDFFRTTLQKDVSVSTMHIYYPEGTLKNVSDNNYFYPATKEITSTDWYQKAAGNAGGFWASASRKDKVKNTYWEMNYYRHIYIPGSKSFAVLAMTTSDNYIRNLITSGNFSVYLTLNQGPVFYSSDRKNAGIDFPAAIDYTRDYYSYSGFLPVDGTKSISAILTLKPFNSKDKLYIMVADKTASAHINSVTVSFLLILLVAVLIPFLIIWLFSEYFTNRVRTLRLAMNRVSNNDYNLVDSISGDDELSATFYDLKIMAENIKKTEANIYEAAIKEQDMINHQQQIELKMLASQINPHFLYNTLEMIRMMAFSSGDKEVATAIKLLGRSMRYVLSSTGTTATTLDKAIAHIDNYLQIQKLRFGDRLQYEIVIDDRLVPSEITTLPLLMQPLVENAISHGIHDSEKNGHIIIRIRQKQQEEQSILFVQIYDNGIGMDQETLQKVREKMSSHLVTEQTSIGLYNINNRIRLYFGSQYGIQIQSKPGFGTLITLTIPILTTLSERVHLEVQR